MMHFQSKCSQINNAKKARTFIGKKRHFLMLFYFIIIVFDIFLLVGLQDLEKYTYVTHFIVIIPIAFVAMSASEQIPQIIKLEINEHFFKIKFRRFRKHENLVQTKVIKLAHIIALECDHFKKHLLIEMPDTVYRYQCRHIIEKVGDSKNDVDVTEIEREIRKHHTCGHEVNRSKISWRDQDLSGLLRFKSGK